MYQDFKPLAEFLSLWMSAMLTSFAFDCLVGAKTWLGFCFPYRIAGPPAFPRDDIALAVVAILIVSRQCVISPHDGYLLNGGALSSPRDGSFVV